MAKKKLEAAGLDFLTVHGRTVKQRSEPVDLDLIRDIKASLRIPVLANGDVRSLEDARETRRRTGCDGVMSARGMLENPAMFAGWPETPAECVRDWLREGVDKKKSNYFFGESHRYFLYFFPL